MIKISKKTCFFLIWIVVFLVSGINLYLFSMRPGAHEVKNSWPKSIYPRLEAGKPNLVMFIHPKCDCSKASIQELSKLIKSHPSVFAVRVFVTEYPSQKEAALEIYKILKTIPGIRVHPDEQGKISHSVGAKTSGITYLIDQNQKIVFQGGLTPSRGHMGPTQGQDFIHAWVSKRSPSSIVEKVFGCVL